MYAGLREFREQEEPFDLYREVEYGGRSLRQAVPVVIREAIHLARYYPVIWRRMAEGFELVALRSLAPEEAGHFVPPVRPLLVEAFPFAGAGAGTSSYALMIDQCTTPPQGGQPAFSADGGVSGETQRRLDALQVFLHDRARSQAATESLAAHGLIEPWDVDLTISGHRVALTGLAIATRDPETRWRRLRDANLAGELDLVRLLVAHDLSLFNMQRLVQLHRGARAPGAVAAPLSAESFEP